MPYTTVASDGSGIHERQKNAVINKYHPSFDLTVRNRLRTTFIKGCLKYHRQYACKCPLLVQLALYLTHDEWTLPSLSFGRVHFHMHFRGTRSDFDFLFTFSMEIL